ncbi:methylated-DNA--[protein]-cysteine S-methyltransferase [Bacillus horti]|uniref:Methylated-DNA--protein-cysteine methyltransferase n=1 Tax=Caldalkalibacillus horti TaxID=77523 RepID=A0ABT9VZW9_9BACI|nr:methylated-DNA--[protein]-cysteine S-methyltransferase [Bacillus horti]MDQ0166539.1 O-6-methylguanine DNA methyltransferase [Bacillus horti]
MTRPAYLLYSEMESPIGLLTLVRSKSGLCKIEFGAGETALRTIERWCKRHFLVDQLQKDDLALFEIKQQLEQYFLGKRLSFEGELDVQGTAFQKLVWTVLQRIPYGELWSYKQVAQEMGSPKAVRAVGGANNKNPLPIVIPCHRVVGSNGALVGYGGGLSIKEKLIAIEERETLDQLG